MAKKRKKAESVEWQVEELLASTWGLEPGPAKIAVLEEAVRLADSHNDVDLAYEVRQELIEATTFGGRPDLAMVAFAWCLAQADAEPDRYDHFDLLWKYKWVVDAAPDYPTISREQHAAMLEDMTRRYKAFGSTMHPVYQCAREAYRYMGDLKAAKAAHAKAQKVKPDILSNCPACEQHALVKFYLDINRPALAFKKAEPLVSGRMGCAEVPHTTFSYLLLPKLFGGDPETAAEYHRRGTRLMRHNAKFLPQAARHVIFLAVTDNLPAAARYFEKNLFSGLTTTTPAWRFEFARAAVFVLDRIAERPRPPRIRIQPGTPLPEGMDGSDPTALRDYFEKDARKLAAKFNARNGNDSFTRQMDELAELKKRVVPYKI